MTERSLVLVVAAPSLVTAAVRDVLRDWVTLGIVRPFLWIDAGEVATRGAFGSVVAARITRDRAERVRLGDYLANQHDLDLVRLTAFNVAGAADAFVDPDVAGYLYTGLGSYPVTAISAVATRHGAGGWRTGFERLGWHNLVIAPEDAWSPDRQPSQYLENSNDEEFVAHAAASLASITGLWPGVGRAPFDGIEPPIEQVQVVRAFHRRLDASAVGSKLRHALTDMSGGLPRPRDHYGSCEHLQRPDTAADSIADGVMGRHARLFEFQLEPEPVPEREAIGAWAAVKQFFRLLLEALRRAPGELVSRVVNSAAAATSRTVQNALFGAEGSRYEVVTRGVNAKGLPPGLDELEAAAHQVRERVASAIVMDEVSAPEAASFWMDVAGAGLMLADGGERVPGVPAVPINGRPGIVPEADWVAPDPAASFVLPPSTAARLGSGQVLPHDLRLAEQAGSELQAASTTSAAAHRDFESFRSWYGRVARGFTARIGGRMVRDMRERAALVRQLLERLQQLQQTSVDQEALQRRGRRSRNLIRNHTIALLVVVLVVVLLYISKLLGGLVIAGLAALGLLCVLVSLALGLVREQRLIHKILARQRLADEQAAVASRNLAKASAALYTTTYLYRQYLAWAPVLGQLLREPFGSVAAPAPALRLTGVLPRSMGFGIAMPDQDGVDRVAHELGGQLFATGWLDGPFQSLLRNAPDRLGRLGHQLRENPNALFADAAQGPHSLLVQWSGMVAQDGVGGDGGADLWRKARDLLAAGAVPSTPQLMRTVEWQAQEAHGVDAAVTAEQFLAGLTTSLSDTSGHRFDSDLFQPEALSDGLHRVRDTIVVGTLASRAERTDPNLRAIPPAADENGLGQFVVAVQTTPGMRSTSLKLLGDAEPQQSPVPEAAPLAPDSIVVD